MRDEYPTVCPRTRHFYFGHETTLLLWRYMHIDAGGDTAYRLRALSDAPGYRKKQYLGASPESATDRREVRSKKEHAMAKKKGNRRKSAGDDQVVISRQDLEAIAQGIGGSLRVRIASRDEAWNIFRDAFNAVLPDLLPEAMPPTLGNPVSSPIPESAPDPQKSAPRHPGRTSKRRKTVNPK